MTQTEHAGHPIAFPEISTFRELFLKDGERKSGIKAPVLKTFRWRDEYPEKDAGTFEVKQEVIGLLDMHRSTGPSINILELAPCVLEFIEERMLRVSHDQIHFQIVNWADGRALVIVSYGQILGSHYLAIIDQASIPNEVGVIPAQKEARSP